MTAEPVEILLVEDRDEDAELALRALRERNLANKIVRVRDGAEALDYLLGAPGSPAKGKPRVVLLDLKLPKVDGIEVLRRVKADERTRTIPVVVLTSSREERDLVRTYDLGVNSFVTKPVGFEEFAEAVGQLGLYWLLLNRQPGP
ncbi:MAG: response regulator [Planctomycetales bacterium]|nr:response regulator [Planctomycetales bacterium]